MLSTSSKIACGYILLIALLFGAIGYIYRQMTLLTEPTGLEETINSRRRSTHQVISKLYEAEIIGQTLHVGRLHEYPRYKKAMREVGTALDSLQALMTDTLQLARLDTVRSLLQEKERNMRSVLEVLRQNPTDELYRQQLDSLISQQDSLLNSATRVKRKVITHHNSYTIHHKKKGFFKRLKDVFAPGKEDSTQVSNVVQEVFTDTIDEIYSPVDTIANMLTGIHDKVLQSQQKQQRTLDARTSKLRIAGSNLSKRVNQLLENIEEDEQIASHKKLEQELYIRNQAAWTMATISILAVILVLVFFTIIWRDITRSNHYRKELEKAKLYAENLLVAREKLMLTITHDIKAPAGSIIGYIDLLIRLVKDKREQFYLANMKSSAQHLLDLVTSLLDYHRLEAGKMDLHPVAFNPHQLFETIYTSFLPLAEKKGLKLIFDEKIPQQLTLEGDPFRIRQIAENLLSNALKFTAQGSITLQTNYQGNQFTFQVTDTGCGMTPQEQERVFQEFTRLRSAQGQEGFGLGLSITKKLVELLMGKITIESTLKKGSTFSVSMPLPSISQCPATEKPEQFQSDSPLNVLLIDDDRIQMNLTEAMLHNLLDPKDRNGKKNVTVKCCEQPEDLFQLIREEHFDILFTDIQMPAMNGFELLKAIRELNVPQAKTLPVIAITARSDMEDGDFHTQGFAGRLHKPFNQNDLSEVLHKVISPDLHPDPSPSLPTGTDPVVLKGSGHPAYNFSPLTAFSADDEEAAHEILTTFARETTRNLERMQQALDENDADTLCAIAHKMLPTFTMIEAHEAIQPLKDLEQQRDRHVLTEEMIRQAESIIECARNVVREIG